MTGPVMSSSLGTLARGLAMIAAAAVVIVAGRSLWPERRDKRAVEPACAGPVEVVEGLFFRLGCSNELALLRCGRLDAGDRVRLYDVGCERLAGGMSGAMRLISDLPLDLNRASAADFELIEGIGPKLAAAIVDDREVNGRFASFEALDRVHGVGPAMLERLRPFLVAADVKEQRGDLGLR